MDRFVLAVITVVGVGLLAFAVNSILHVVEQRTRIKESAQEAHTSATWDEEDEEDDPLSNEQ